MKTLTSGDRKEEIEVSAKPETPEQTIDRLQARVTDLEHRLQWAGVEYAKLKEIYDKLADQWNAFQATAKPTNRNVHRAEASGELARKLAEIFIGLAYDTSTLEDLQEFLRTMNKRPLPADKLLGDRVLCVNCRRAQNNQPAGPCFCEDLNA